MLLNKTQSKMESDEDQVPIIKEELPDIDNQTTMCGGGDVLDPNVFTEFVSREQIPIIKEELPDNKGTMCARGDVLNSRDLSEFISKNTHLHENPHIDVPWRACRNNPRFSAEEVASALFASEDDIDGDISDEDSDHVEVETSSDSSEEDIGSNDAPTTNTTSITTAGHTVSRKRRRIALVPAQPEIIDEQVPTRDDDEENDEPGTSGRLYIYGKDKKAKWRRSRVTIRTRSTNIVTNIQGPVGAARAAKTPWQCFNLFMTDEIIESIVKDTNIRIELMKQKYTGATPTINLTSYCEIKACFGLLILAGVLGGGRINLDEYWSTDGLGVDIFRSTMSLNRFRFLLRCLRFDDRSTRAIRREVDKLAGIRQIFEMFVINCRVNYSMGSTVTIDEMLLAFRGKCSFRMYIPSKPAKYGLKVHALADSTSYYVANMEIYAGAQPEGPYEIINSGAAVVNRLIGNTISHSNRNLTIDNWYMSYPLAMSLLNDHQITCVGTLRKNKRDIPPAMLTQVPHGGNNTHSFAFQKDATLVAYRPKPRKLVLLLSTMHHTDAIDPASGKSEVVTFYNKTKGGVDVVDKLSATYDVSRNSRRWTLTIFFGLINVAGVNANVIYKHNTGTGTPNDLERRGFLKELGCDMVQDLLKTRAQKKNLPRQLRSEIAQLLPSGQPTIAQIVVQGDAATKKRCYLCPRKTDAKFRVVCGLCNRFVCMTHRKIICHECEIELHYQ